MYLFYLAIYNRQCQPYAFNILLPMIPFYKIYYKTLTIFFKYNYFQTCTAYCYNSIKHGHELRHIVILCSCQLFSKIFKKHKKKNVLFFFLVF